MVGRAFSRVPAVIRTLETAQRFPVAGYDEVLAVDGAALATAPLDPERGVLTLYRGDAEGLLVGRYHLVPPSVSGIDGPVRVARRRTGGRVVPFGPGFLGLSLVLPHRAALVADDWRALAPEQVMNRCVRGVLGGLRACGVPAFYPGRDLITVGGRALGMTTFEVTGTGALLFEACLALNADLAVTPRLLDRLDAAGVIKTAMVSPSEVTTVARAAGRSVDAATLAMRIVSSYADVFGLTIVDAQGEAPPGARPQAGDRAWLRSRTPRDALDRRALRRVQLGLLEVHCARHGDRLGDVMLSGDFLANAVAIERLERRLEGLPCEWAAVSACVFEEFGQPENFLLGVGDLSVVADLVCDAVGAPARRAPR